MTFLNQSFGQQGQCGAHSECRADKGWRCTCNEGHYTDSAGLCHPLKTIGTLCSANYECQENAECPDDTPSTTGVTSSNEESKATSHVSKKRKICKCLRNYLPNEYGGCGSKSIITLCKIICVAVCEKNHKVTV